MRKINLLFLSLILLASSLLGSRMILAGDFFYLFDQARDYLLVKDIVDTQNLALIGTHSGLGGFFHGPLWLYMLAPVYLLGNDNPFSFTYFYIGLQFATILAAYIVGSRLYGSRGGILTSLLIALSPITWSTVPNTIGVNAVPLVFLELFYFLTKFLRGDRKSFIFAAFFAGLSLQFETALPLVLIPVLFIAYCLFSKPIINLKLIFLSFLSYLLSLSTFILFDLRHKFLMSNALLGAFGGGQKEKGYLELADRIPAHFNSLLGTYRSILFKEDSMLTLLLSIIFVFAMVLIIKNKIKYRNEFLFLLLFPVLVFMFFVFYSYPIWPEYVLGLLIPVVFAFYLAITTIWKNLLGKILVILFFAITFLNVFLHIKTQYFQKYIPNNTAGSYVNQKAVVDWIFNDSAQGKFGYFVYTPETFTHGMDYLISWEAKRYPGKIPTKNKERSTYLILYPHMAQDEGAYAFWKKNVLRTQAQVVLTKLFRGGITVEKLQIDKSEPEVDPNYYQGLLFR